MNRPISCHEPPNASGSARTDITASSSLCSNEQRTSGEAIAIKGDIKKTQNPKRMQSSKVVSAIGESALYYSNDDIQ
ncbi:hypothetical protein CS8_045350 [Cupriavidus sp. 8B]